ncbi:MAG: hypothetical protein HC915_21750 [Anaerolineae bacterium]|nr:hypothetical protein [Anaerolineae bacterium]
MSTSGGKNPLGLLSGLLGRRKGEAAAPLNRERLESGLRQMQAFPERSAPWMHAFES